MNRTTFALSAAALLALTGTTASAAQAKAAYHEDRAVQPARSDARAGSYEFHKASKLIGTDVVNPNGDTIAEIQDFIADRGDGRITHVLIESGDVLGIGGKTVAVPFERLAYNAADETFTLDMTKEQIERAAEFVPENWADLQHATWTEKMDRWFSGESDDAESNTAAAVEDAYADSVRNGRTNEIRGTITRVDRVRASNGWEEVTLTVNDKDGKSHELVLGPSWYVMSQDAAPMRGQTIEAEAVPLTRDNMNRQVVVSADINGRDLELRNKEGLARWNLTGDERRSQHEQGHGRLVLVSDVVGADVLANANEDAGEVNDVLIERYSGQVAAVGLDPDDNFLGIGDDIKLVPWSLVSVLPSGKVRIDANKEMIKGGQNMPEDVSVYGTPARFEPVYTSYGVDVYKFEPRDTRVARNTDRDMKNRPQDARSGAWSHDSKICRQFRDGQKVSFTGKITAVRTDSIDPTIPDARVLVVSTDDGERRVVVGPSWYLDKQNLKLRDGDRVTVSGRKAVVNGREYVAAWTLEGPDDKTLTLWDDDNAAWDSSR